MMTQKGVKYLILVVTVFLFISSLILFLWNTPKFNTGSSIDSSKFAEFGGFIAGVLGTFFSGLTLVIILFTYEITKDTYNIAKDTYRITKESNEFNGFNNLYKSLNDDINDAYIKDGAIGELRGTVAYKSLSPDRINTGILDNINLVVHSFEMALDYVEKLKVSDTDIKIIYLDRLYLLYYAKVLWPLREPIVKYKDKLMSDSIIEGGNRQNSSGHDDSKSIIPKYGEIGTKCLDYLEERHLVEKSAWKIKVREQLKTLQAKNTLNSG